MFRVGEHKNRGNLACRVVPGGSAVRSILLGSVLGCTVYWAALALPTHIRNQQPSSPAIFFSAFSARYDHVSGG